MEGSDDREGVALTRRMLGLAQAAGSGLLTLLLSVAPMSAQSDQRWYVTAGIAAPKLSGRSDTNEGKSRFELPGGWTHAWSIGGGRRWERGRLETEFSQSGKIDDLYTVRLALDGANSRFASIRETRQDQMVGGRWRWHTASHFKWAPFVGGGAIHYRCREREVNGLAGESTAVSCDNGWSWYVTSGVGSAIQIGRLALIPSIAVSLLGLNGDMTQRYTSDAQAHQPWSMTPALHARFEF